MYLTAQLMERPKLTSEALLKSIWPVGLLHFESDTNQILMLFIIGAELPHPIILNPRHFPQQLLLQLQWEGFLLHRL